jgi:CheY-like chemotaxis protein
MRAQSDTKAGSPQEEGMKQPRLLLIDDEPALAAFVADIARDCGFDAQLTSTNEQFRSSLLAARPDMIALDLGMPGMDGVELLRFLAEQDCRAPVLIISGFDRRVLESAFRLGEALGLEMIGPLEKPVRAHQLELLLTEMRSSLAQ